MKNLFEVMFKKGLGLGEPKAEFQPLYINPPSFLHTEGKFEMSLPSTEIKQDEMQIDNIYRSL